MTDPAAEGGNIDDGVLTAYLDGELAGAERAALEKRFLTEPALKVRLDHLGRGGRAFGPAYDALMAAAPADRLEAILAKAKDARGRARRGQGARRKLVALAAAVVIFVAGGLAGHFIPGTEQAQGDTAWRQVVADYQGLTTTETLAAIPDNPGTIAQELTLIGGKLSLDLSSQKLALPDAALKRADLFQFAGKPLVQLAYLTDADGPVAFCIIANGHADAGPAFEQREGFNIVYWTDGGHSYMLIGKAPRATLEAYAGDLAARV
jgi:anti-sigma factor RsiW